MPPFRAIRCGLSCLGIADLVAHTPLRPFVSGANFCRLVLRELYSGSTDAERCAPVGPIEWYALQQPRDGHGARQAALDDRLDDIGGEISKPRETADMRTTLGPPWGAG